MGEKLNNNLPNINNLRNINLSNNAIFPSSFAFEFITVNEIVNTISSLKNRKSTGADGLGAKLIFEAKEIFAPILQHIFNFSVTSGIFPHEMKIAKIIPIPKNKNDLTSIVNYRPISLLSIFSKVFETIMSNRIRKFLNKFNILYKFQFGFREKHSTTLALINSFDDIIRNLGNGDLVAGLFLDLSKAFDSLNHGILFDKLFNIGIRGIMLKWIKSYFSDRMQFTCVNQTESSYGEVKFGVPQGSVLGPLLFIVYINDIGSIPGLKFLPKLFADDANVFVHAKNFNELQIQSQNTLNLLTEWLLLNRLTINIKKTCYIIFTPHSSNIIPNDFTLKVDNSPIDRVEQSKFLGVQVDSKLNWGLHIKELCIQLRRYVGIFFINLASLYLKVF